MIRQETAETVALKALTWMLEQDEIMQLFLAETGASMSDLTAVASEPQFLASVLDFLMLDDMTVIAACDAIGLPHDGLMQARASLPGGVVPDWT